MAEPRSRPAWADLATEILGQDLYQWLRDRRELSNPHAVVPGWRRLCTELAYVTAGRVAVTHNTLFTFYRNATATVTEARTP